MGTLGLFVLCAIFLFTGNGAPVEKRRESTKEILELESLLKKSAGEDKQVFPSQLEQEAKAKEAKLAAESDAREKEDDGIDIPLLPPEMQVDGLAEKDELVAQLKQQIAATEYLKEQEDENNDAESETEEQQEETEETNEEETEDTEDEPELMDEGEKREQELFMKYLKDSPELWQQLMDSLEYGNDEDDWQQGRYTDPDDEYPAVMQEWRAAADNNLQNYIPQDNYEPELSQDKEDEELENELPQIPREFNNLEELQEYYGDKLAEEGSKKIGYARPDWVDEDENDNIPNKLEEANADTDDEHSAQKRSPVQDHPIM